MTSQEYQELRQVAMRVMRGQGTSRKSEESIYWVKASEGDTLKEVSVHIEMSFQDKEDVFHNALETWITKERGKLPTMTCANTLCGEMFDSMRRAFFGQLVKFAEINYYRSVKRLKLREYNQDYRPIDEYVSPENYVLQAEKMMEIKERTGELADVALLLLAGYTQREISEKLGTYPMAVNRQVKKLREVLSA